MFSRTSILNLILAIALLSVAGVTGFAQQTQTRDQGKDQNLDRGPAGRKFGPHGGHGFSPTGKYGPHILEQLNLTDDQRAQVKGIVAQTFASNQGAREEMRQLGEKRRQGTLSTDDQERARTLHQQMQKSFADTETRIEGVLTSEQKTKAQQLINERKTEFDRHGGRGRGNPGRRAPDQPSTPKPAIL
jgi:Spy/CpxP family protein refolding chaperone